uniref:PDZ domain-containing protein n=1 Tax=Timema monikensis TaxID=170555 RepID=A0A7R9HJ00_9NEOP|nr:unnamed protein product [Timema monikensis]
MYKDENIGPEDGGLLFNCYETAFSHDQKDMKIVAEKGLKTKKKIPVFDDENTTPEDEHDLDPKLLESNDDGDDDWKSFERENEYEEQTGAVTLEVGKCLQFDNITWCGEVPATKLAALQKVLQSDFLNAVREVYEHVYETVDIQGSQDIRASATAKATVAAFAASEGHAHPRVVELPKTEEGLGFNVMGGKEQNSPIYISRIIPGGVADRHGGLKRGDQLLSVNGVSVEGENHEKAVELLKQAQGSVKLVVRYTPKVLEEMEMRFDKQRAARRRQFQ